MLPITSDDTIGNVEVGVEDNSLDVPSAGVGYYLIPQVDGEFKYTNAGTKKFSQYTGGSTSRMVLKDDSKVTVTAGSYYQIREYNFETDSDTKETKTISKSITFTDDKLFGNVAVPDGDAFYIDEGKGGTYNLWYDYNNKTLGFETAAIKENVGSSSYNQPVESLQEGLNRKVNTPKKATGDQRYLYLKWTDNIWKTWNAGASNIKLHLFGGTSATTWDGALANSGSVTFNGEEFLKWDIGSHLDCSSCIFRVTTSGWGLGSQHQTGNLTIPSNSPNNLFVFNSSNNSTNQTGDWCHLYTENDSNWFMTSSGKSWNTSSSSLQFVYSASVNNNFQYVSKYSIVLEKDEEFRMVLSDSIWKTPALMSNSTDFSTVQNSDNLKANRAIKANFSLQAQKGNANWTGLYWTEVFSNVSASSNDDSYGTVSISSSSVSYKGTTTLTATPKTGYQFLGWKKDGGDSYVSTNATYTPTITDDCSFVGYFAPKTSALTFSMNEKTASNTPTTSGLTATYGSAMPSIPTLPTVSGYNFTGYYDAASGGTQYYTNLGGSARNWDKNTTSGTTLYAHWTASTYNINYVLAQDGKDGPTAGNVTFESSQPTSFTYSDSSSDKVTLVNVSDSTKTYSFKGWYTTSDFSGTAVTELTRNHTDHYTLYAKWAQTYTVSFDSGNGGSGTIAPVEVNKGASYSLPTSDGFTAPAGYIFAGWNTSADAEGARLASGDSVPVTGNVTYYAQWKRTIALNKGNGTFDYSEYDHIYGINFALSKLGNPTLSGYTFAGWYDVDGTLVATLNNSTKSPLTARYSRTITFDSHGGSSIGNLTHVYGTSININVNSYTPSRDGYEFAGWYDASSLGNQVTSVSNSLTVTTLHAYWNIITYNISYTGIEGATISPANKGSYCITTTSFTLTNPTKTGYTFTGWSGTGLTGEGNTTVTIAQGSTEHRTYTAHWEAIVLELNATSSHSASVTFYSDSGRSSEIGNVAYDSTVYYTVAGATGYSGFNGSFVIRTGSGFTFDWENSSVLVSLNDCAGYSFQIAFDGNKGTGSSSISGTMPNQTGLTYGESDAITANEFGRDGYSFTGWKVGNAGSLIVDEAAITGNVIPGSNNATITLYAQWEAITYEVAFSTSEGTGEMSNQSFTFDQAQSLTAMGLTADTGRHFLYWTANSDGTGTQYSDQQSVSNLASTQGAVVTIYAQWTYNTYTVVFNGNKGSGSSSISGSMDNQGFTYGTAQNLSANAYSRDGYDFQGWATTSGGPVSHTDGKSVSNLTATNGGTVDLYAVWQAKTYTVTLDNGNTSITVTATFDAAMPTKDSSNNDLIAPTRTGYSFGGYFASSNGVGTQYYSNAMGSAHAWDIAEDASIFAKWTAIKVTVTLDNQSATTAGTPSVSAFYEQEMPSITIPVKAGYTFAGYFSETNGGGTQYYTNSGTSNHVWDKLVATRLYANWVMQNAFFGGETIYFVPNANWQTNNPRFELYYYNASESGFITMVRSDSSSSSDLSYKATLPGTVSDQYHIIFARMNPNAAEHTWDSKWNQAPKKDYGETQRSDASKNVIVMAEGSWDPENKDYGDWRYYYKSDNNYTFYYFDNRGVWNTPAAYAWDSTHRSNSGDDGYYYPFAQNANWPGVSMHHMQGETMTITVDGHQYSINTNYVWRIEVDKRFNSIIFTDGTGGTGNSNQTVDMTIATSGTSSNQAHDGWFFVLDPALPASGKSTGSWRETILPVNILGTYYDGSTRITTLPNDDLGWANSTFGNEKFTPDETAEADTIYRGDSTNGIFYSFDVYKVDSNIQYYKDAACTQAFSSGSEVLPSNLTLYVKYIANTKAENAYATFYLDYAGTDDTRWNNSAACYFYFGTNSGTFTAYPNSKQTFTVADGWNGYKVSDKLYRVTVPTGTYWFAYNDQFGGSNLSDQFGSADVGIAAVDGALFTPNGLDDAWRRLATTATLVDDSIYGTATIVINDDTTMQTPVTMGLGNVLATSINNYYIYERGVTLAKGDVIYVNVTGATGDHTGLNGNYGFSNYAGVLPSYLAKANKVVVPSTWTNPYYYVWKQGSNPFVSNADYPGEPLIPVKGETNTYYFPIVGTYDRVIFNNGLPGGSDGAEQTVDITIDSNYNVYTLSAEKTDGKFTCTLSSSGVTRLMAMEKVRINAYITGTSKLTMPSVPLLGNGYFIMEGNTGIGFADGIKMTTSADGSGASYSRFKAKPGASYFIRSYIDAVDKKYTSLEKSGNVARDAITTTTPSGGSVVFTFNDPLTTTQYFDIVLQNDKITISASGNDTSTFFRLVDLEIDVYGDSARSVKDQKTSLVLRVAFNLKNIQSMNIFADVTPENNLGAIAGAAMYVTSDPLGDPYTYMRNHYLDSLVTLDSLIAEGDTFATIGGTSVAGTTSSEGQTIYAYFLFDYVIPEANIPTTVIDGAAKFSILLRAEQA